MKTTKSNSKTSPTTNATQGGTVASLASASIRNRPKRLEMFDFGTIHRHIFRETDCAEWLPCFKNIAVNIGGPFKTRLGSFELTCQFEPISTLLTLIGGKDKSKLTARLVHQPLSPWGIAHQGRSAYYPALPLPKIHPRFAKDAVSDRQPQESDRHICQP